MSTLFDGRQLIFKVDTTGARINHGLHQFERIQDTTKPSFSIGHDRHKIVHISGTTGALDLVCPLESIVDPSHNRGHRIDRVKRLIWIHGITQIGICSDLPARQINRLNTGFNLLDCLTTRQSAQGRDKILGVNPVPQFLSTEPSQRILDLDRPLESHHIRSCVITLDVLPAGVFRPVLLDRFSSIQPRFHIFISVNG